MKGPGLALIIAEHMKKKGGPSMMDKPESDMPEEDSESKQHDMEMSAVQDLMDAIKSDDAEAAHAALKDLIDLCSGGSEEQE